MRWKSHVRFGERTGKTDPPRGWHRVPVRLHTALSVTLPHAVRVLDAFHVVKVRHEAPCFRAEVRDHRHRAVAAAR
jgi:hypothetical protein